MLGNGIQGHPQRLERQSPLARPGEPSATRNSMTDTAPTVLIVGNEGLLVEGLRQFFDSIGLQAQRHLGPTSPGSANAPVSVDILIVLDDPAQAGEARTLMDALQKQRPETKLLLLRPSFTPTQVRDALQMGFHAILLRSVSQDALGHTIRLLLLGETVLAVSLAAMLLDLGEQTIEPGVVGERGFSRRELQILACLVRGQPNKVIAQDLGVSEATVKVQLRHLLKKIGVANRTQAAIWALGRNVVRGKTPGRGAEPSKGDVPGDAEQDR